MISARPQKFRDCLDVVSIPKVIDVLSLLSALSFLTAPLQKLCHSDVVSIVKVIELSSPFDFIFSLQPPCYHTFNTTSFVHVRTFINVILRKA